MMFLDPDTMAVSRNLIAAAHPWAIREWFGAVVQPMAYCWTVCRWGVCWLNCVW